MTLHRTLATSAALTLAVAGLAACGGEDEPAQSSSTASPTVVESDPADGPATSPKSATTEQTPSLPSAATKQTAKGALEFGKFYQDQLGEIGVTRDTTLLKSMSEPRCKPCSAVIETVKEENAQGLTRSKNPVSVSDARVNRRSDKGYRVSMQVESAAHEQLDSEGKKVAEADAVSYDVVQDVQWVDGQWVLRNWVVVTK